MRLRMILPRVEPDFLPVPQECPACHSPVVAFHQEVPKPLRDPHYEGVSAHRYECQSCRHSFRVYPPAVVESRLHCVARGLPAVTRKRAVSPFWVAFGVCPLPARRWRVGESGLCPVPPIGSLDLASPK